MNESKHLNDDLKKYYGENNSNQVEFKKVNDEDKPNLWETPKYNSFKHVFNFLSIEDVFVLRYVNLKGWKINCDTYLTNLISKNQLSSFERCVIVLSYEQYKKNNFIHVHITYKKNQILKFIMIEKLDFQFIIEYLIPLSSKLIINGNRYNQFHKNFSEIFIKDSLKNYEEQKISHPESVKLYDKQYQFGLKKYNEQLLIYKQNKSKENKKLLFELKSNMESQLCLRNRFSNEIPVIHSRIEHLKYPYLTELILNQVCLANIKSNEGSLYFLKSFNSLKSLTFNECSYVLLSRASFLYKNSHEKIEILFRKTNKTMNWKFSKSLETLKIEKCYINDKSIEYIGRTFKNLKHIKLSNINEITDDSCIEMLKKLNKLEHLDIRKCKNLSKKLFNASYYYRRKLTSLNFLRLVASHGIFYGDHDNFIVPQNLKYVDFSRTYTIDNHVLNKIISLNNLTSLCLHQCYLLDNQSFENTKGNKNLKKLWLGGIPLKNGITKILKNKFPNLILLDLSKNENITSEIISKILHFESTNIQECLRKVKKCSYEIKTIKFNINTYNERLTELKKNGVDKNTFIENTTTDDIYIVTNRYSIVPDTFDILPYNLVEKIRDEFKKDLKNKIQQFCTFPNLERLIIKQCKKITDIEVIETCVNLMPIKINLIK